jgi:class 3 adenylate cyclase/tetratricopeptide (TPR) repeat protein
VKCNGCGFENAAGIKFCGECGKPLKVACPSCAFENHPGIKFCGECGRPLHGGREAPDPRSYTPHHLAEKILTSRSALEGERKQVTVLFADVKGSMDLAEQVDPEEWHGIMDRFLQILADGVHRFEGTINQYTGDGMMALFGAPVAHEDHAARACYAALALKDELRRYSDELRVSRGLNFAVRMGLNSGEVVVGKIGDDLRMDYTAQGHTVGLAARMEQTAAPDSIYLSDHTARLVSGRFTLRDLGQSTVKGASSAVGVHELTGAGSLRTRFEVARTRGLTRFVGREDDMDTLDAALVKARDGKGRVVGVVGEPGVGKSRLSFEFAERCRSLGLTVLEGRAVSHGKNIPLLPMLQVFRAYYGITEHDTDRAAREKIAGRLVLIDESFREVLPLLFEFFGVADPDRPALRIDPEARQRQLFGVLRRVLRREDTEAPIVWLIEDLHWIDQGSEAFLAEWVEAIAGTRNLLLVNFRPEYHAPWMQKSYYHQLPVSPLAPEATRELVGDLLGKHPSLVALGDAIHAHTAGNPFFIEEVVQSLIESGHLSGTRGSYRLATPVEKLQVPGTVQSVLAARIDRLSERDKRVLQTSAVIGKNFTEPVLKRVAGLGEAELAASLAALRQAEFVYEEALYPDAEYAFKHPLTQEVAYGSQLAARRSETHSRIARAIPEVYPERLDERAALLAHHCEAAGEPLQAARWHRRAAEWAGVSDPRTAHLHWTKVRELLGSAPESSDDIALGVLACSRILQFGWRLGAPDEETVSVFHQGRDLAARAGDLRSLAMLLSGYGAARGLAGDVRKYVEHATEGFRVARDTNDPALVLGIRSQLSYGLFSAGRFQELIPILEEGITNRPQDLELGRDIVGYCPYAMTFAFRGAAETYTGVLDRASKTLDSALELARRHRDLEVASPAHAWKSELHQVAGDVAAALAHARQAVEIAEKIGSAFWLLFANTRLALAQLLSKDWDEAVERLDEVLRTARGCRTGLEEEPFILAALAEAHLGRGDATAARRAADEAVLAAERGGMRFYGALAELTLARVLLRAGGSGAPELIRLALERALERLRETGARTYEPFVRIELAELARLKGDAVERQRELREAHRLFLEIGAPLRAAQVAKDLSS